MSSYVLLSQSCGDGGRAMRPMKFDGRERESGRVEGTRLDDHPGAEAAGIKLATHAR